MAIQTTLDLLAILLVVAICLEARARITSMTNRWLLSKQTRDTTLQQSVGAADCAKTLVTIHVTIEKRINPQTG